MFPALGLHESLKREILSWHGQNRDEKVKNVKQIKYSGYNNVTGILYKALKC